MTSIPKFDSEIYSEELYTVAESEYDEVMMEMAQESEGFQGYSDWSAQLEQAQFEREQERKATRINTPHGEILIRKECTHPTCRTTRCAKAVKLGGIEL